MRTSHCKREIMMRGTTLLQVTINFFFMKIKPSCKSGGTIFSRILIKHLKNLLYVEKFTGKEFDVLMKKLFLFSSLF